MSSESISRGQRTRAEVLGLEHVSASLANDADFAAPLEALVTEFCWDRIWNRPGLDRRTRSALNLAMLTALNRPDQLGLHIKGALNNGLTQEEIQEVLLHTAVYCGAPAAMSAFKVAKSVLAEGARP